MTFLRKLLVPLMLASSFLLAVPATAQADTACAVGGGTRICEYPLRTWTFSTGKKQEFIIGTNWAVWTRWQQSNGSWTLWQTLGGEIKHSLLASDFLLLSCNSQPMLKMRGTDNRWWYKARASSGSWSVWTTNGILCG